MAIFDKNLREDIDFDIEIKPSLHDSHFRMSTPIKNLSIDEMAEILGFICQIQPTVFYEPFPHIDVDTYYGEITIFDTEKGHLDRKIEITDFSIRCVFNDMLNVSESDIHQFNKDGCSESKLVTDNDRLIFQSEFKIQIAESVESLLSKLLNMSSRCERLYTMSAMRCIHNGND